MKLRFLIFPVSSAGRASRLPGVLFLFTPPNGRVQGVIFVASEKPGVLPVLGESSLVFTVQCQHPGLDAKGVLVTF